MKNDRGMIIFVIIAMFFFVSIFGCQGSCIKIAGGYKDYGGEVEYCFDKEQSKTVQSPVLTDSDGKTFFGITEDEIKKIVEKLKDKVSGLATDSTPLFLQMRELIDK